MKCENCGAEIAEDSRFCPNCGRSVSEPTGGGPTVESTTRGQVSPPPPRTTEGANRKGIVIALVLVLLIAVGTAAGLLLWKFAFGDGMVATITDIELTGSDGSEVDLDEVPIGEELTLTVDVKAKYGEEGSGKLSYSVIDEAGEKQREGTFEVRSSDSEQSFEEEFYFIWSEGETFTVSVDLEVTEGDKEKQAADSLEFYVVEGEVTDEELEAAIEKTGKKLDEAIDAVAEVGTDTDVNVDDLLQRLTEAYAAFDRAETQEELDPIYQEGEAIIAECANRRAVWEAEQAKKQQEEEQKRRANRDAEIAACKDAMFDYAWRQMVTTPFYAEPVRIDGFWMNDGCTQAKGTMVGMKTAHTDPENAGNTVTVPISASKQGGRWVPVFEAI